MAQMEKTSDEEAPGGVKFYTDYTDDFVESKKQEKSLPENFTWMHKNIFYRLASQLLYGIILVITFFYTRCYLHVKVVNKEVMKQCGKGGCFLFGNHTQPVGDAFAPVRYAFPKRIYTIMGTANLGIPVLGKFLPLIGGIVIPDSLEGMKEFLRTIEARAKKNCIVVYPEAHVWPWCSFVRPFPDTAFRYPVMTGDPSFCMTTTYQERKPGKRPRATVYLDGPFYPDKELGNKKAQQKLHDTIYDCMKRRSENSTFEYIKYVRKTSL